MSLRIRRGTDAERQTVTFLEGELVYTTDTKKVYVGDGSTLGGNSVDTSVGSIDNLSDVNIAGIVTGQVLQWNGAAFIPGNRDKESVFGDDSTLLVDTINSAIVLDGTVRGHIVPDQNIAYDLGSASNRFRDLYLSGTTIDLGGTTISVSGGKVSFSDPVTAEFELSQNMDLKNYYITSTDASPNISLRPGTNANMNVATIAGTKLFEVNLDTNTYGTPAGSKTVLQLPVFNSSDYTAHSADESLGQIVFDDPSKTLKVYNGTSWVTVQGTGGGSGIVEGQIYDISISGDVVAGDSSILVDAINGELKGNVVAANRDVIVASGATSATSTVTVGTVYATDIQADTISAVNAETLLVQGPTRAASSINIGSVTADTISGNFTGTFASDDSIVLLDGVSGRASIADNIVTGTVYQEGSTGIRFISGSGDVDFGGNDKDGNHVNVTLSIDRQASSATGLSSAHYNNSASRHTDVKAFKFRGTIASPAAIISGDKLLEFTANGYDGTSTKPAGDIGYVATGAPTGTVIPSKIVIQVGNVAGTGASTFTGDSDGSWASTFQKITPLSSEPTSPTEGMIAAADRINWDPASKGSGNSYVVYYDGSAWNALF